MNEIITTLTWFAVVVALFGLLVAVASVVIGVKGLRQGAEGLQELSRVGNRLEEEIGMGLEAALKAIVTNGRETRKTIAAVHKSIKEELE